MKVKRKKNQLLRIKLLNVYHFARHGFTQKHIDELREILEEISELLGVEKT